LMEGARWLVGTTDRYRPRNRLLFFYIYGRGTRTWHACGTRKRQRGATLSITVRVPPRRAVVHHAGLGSVGGAKAALYVYVCTGHAPQKPTTVRVGPRVGRALVTDGQCGIYLRTWRPSTAKDVSSALVYKSRDTSKMHLRRFLHNQLSAAWSRLQVSAVASAHHPQQSRTQTAITARAIAGGTPSCTLL
jgi:hypothetical protein